MTLRPTPQTDDLALVLGGGGARGAYQVGLLRGLAKRYPHFRTPIITGVSAGAVNAIHLASQTGSFAEAVEDLAKLWLSLTPDQVFRVDARSLLTNVLRTGTKLLAGGHAEPGRMKSMVDTSPLAAFLEKHLSRNEDGSLPGIAHNLASGKLRSVALTATSYTTAQSVTWVQGKEIELWQRPQRRSDSTNLTVEHVMASSALPLLFPAQKVGDEWYGDGGIRLTAPLSPALHLGASRVVTISTRHIPKLVDSGARQLAGYPPPAQVMGILYNAIFLDLIDQDVVRLQRLNRVLRQQPPEKRGGLRVVDILVLRPSQDLGKLARAYEPRLPKVFRFLTRGLGTQRTSSPDIISLIMFQEDYLQRLCELGEEDAESQADRIAEFVERDPNRIEEVEHELLKDLF